MGNCSPCKIGNWWEYDSKETDCNNNNDDNSGLTLRL